MAFFAKEPRFRDNFQEIRGDTLCTSTHAANNLVGPGYNTKSIFEFQNTKSKSFSKKEPYSNMPKGGRLDFGIQFKGECLVLPNSSSAYDAGPGFYSGKLTNHFEETIHNLSGNNPLLKRSYNVNSPATKCRTSASQTPPRKKSTSLSTQLEQAAKIGASHTQHPEDENCSQSSSRKSHRSKGHLQTTKRVDRAASLTTDSFQAPTCSSIARRLSQGALQPPRSRQPSDNASQESKHKAKQKLTDATAVHSNYVHEDPALRSTPLPPWKSSALHPETEATPTNGSHQKSAQLGVITASQATLRTDVQRRLDEEDKLSGCEQDADEEQEKTSSAAVRTSMQSSSLAVHGSLKANRNLSSHSITSHSHDIHPDEISSTQESGNSLPDHVVVKVSDFEDKEHSSNSVSQNTDAALVSSLENEAQQSSNADNANNQINRWLVKEKEDGEEDNTSYSTEFSSMHLEGIDMKAETNPFEFRRYSSQTEKSEMITQKPQSMEDLLEASSPVQTTSENQPSRRDAILNEITMLSNARPAMTML